MLIIHLFSRLKRLNQGFIAFQKGLFGMLKGALWHYQRAPFGKRTCILGRIETLLPSYHFYFYSWRKGIFFDSIFTL